MHKFRVLSDKTFFEIEDKFNQLEERLSKTEEALSKLENNVADTKEDIEKLELIKMKIDIFNKNMSFTTNKVYLKLEDDKIDLLAPALDGTDHQIRLRVVHTTDSIETIERRLDEQIKALEFYHCFFSQMNVGRLIEFDISRSDFYIARLRFRLEDQYHEDDEVTISLMKRGKIDVEYRKFLNIDVRKKLEFSANAKIRFELSVLDIIDDYDEYYIQAITSELCEIINFKEVMTRLQEEIEMNGQFRQLEFQADN